MGGFTIRHELESLDLLQAHPNMQQIFRDMGWLAYFERLQGCNDGATLELPQNI